MCSGMNLIRRRKRAKTREMSWKRIESGMMSPSAVSENDQGQHADKLVDGREAME